MLRISPQKLNLVAQLIRGKKVATRARRSRVLAQAHRPGCAQMPGIGDRQCREQSRSRRRRSGRRRGACRQGAGDQALHAARPRPRRTIFKPFSHLTIVVREVEAQAEGGSRSRRWVRKSIRSGCVSGSTAPGIRAGMPARRVRHAAARGHEDPRRADEAAQAGGGVQDRDRAAAQEVPRHHPLGASGRGDRQEGRRHREAAQARSPNSPTATSSSTSSKSASRSSMRSWSPN